MSEKDELPFKRDEQVDRPGIIGARWWQEQLDQADPVARRTAMKAIIGGAVALAAIGAFVSASSGPSADDFSVQQRAALEMQREYGWSFGAESEALVFDGVSTSAYDKASLAKLTDDLSPADGDLLPFYVATLFQSLTAQRRFSPPGDPVPFQPLRDVLKPIFTPKMQVAFLRGLSLASLFQAVAHPGAQKVAVVVDLPGPEAVAFAAGAAEVLDPVFLFDNWPHPRGVVASHLTLAAAAFFQPLFARARTTSKRARMFVLDDARLTPYVDDALHFDNRYAAQLPSLESLRKLAVERLIYVNSTYATNGGFELDDLNDDFVRALAGGVTVRRLAADSFGPDDAAASGLDAGRAAPAAPLPPPADTPRYFYGHHLDCHEWFWVDYPYSDHPAAKREPTLARPELKYAPAPRPKTFSASHRPADFGTVPVVIAIATGAILGAKMSRSGSWTRASGWGGG